MYRRQNVIQAGEDRYDAYQHARAKPAIPGAQDNRSYKEEKWAAFGEGRQSEGNSQREYAKSEGNRIAPES